MSLREIKSPFSIFLLMIMFIMFLLLHNFVITTREIVKLKQLEVQPDTRSERLVQLLRETTMPDRTVIVSMVGQAWAGPGSILDLFLESFHIGQDTKRLLDHLLIVALDRKAFHYCDSIHPHCFHLTNHPTTNYTSKKPLTLSQLKYKFFAELITLGYNFIFTDADIMWLRNPVSLIHPTIELVIACDFNSDDLPNLDYIREGFFFMKSNEIVMDYFRYWELARFLYLNEGNRSLCQTSVSDQDTFEAFGLHVEYLDMDNFGGICQQRENMAEIYTMRTNCCENIGNKVHDLRLFLDDWRNFTALSKENTSLKGSLFTWRAPDKCQVMNKRVLT